MKPKFPTARDKVIHVGDDHWWLAAVVTLYSGGAALLLGLLSRFGWNPSVPNPTAVVVGGLLGICVGAWVLYRRIGIVIDSTDAIVTMRSPLSERRVLFSNLSH